MSKKTIRSLWLCYFNHLFFFLNVNANHVVHNLCSGFSVSAILPVCFRPARLTEPVFILGWTWILAGGSTETSQACRPRKSSKVEGFTAASWLGPAKGTQAISLCLSGKRKTQLKKRKRKRKTWTILTHLVGEKAELGQSARSLCQVLILSKSSPGCHQGKKERKKPVWRPFVVSAGWATRWPTSESRTRATTMTCTAGRSSPRWPSWWITTRRTTGSCRTRTAPPSSSGTRSTVLIPPRRGQSRTHTHTRTHARTHTQGWKLHHLQAVSPLKGVIKVFLEKRDFAS